MTVKIIRASESTWSKLRSIAYQRQTYIKNVLDDIMEGRIDPTKIKIVWWKILRKNYYEKEIFKQAIWMERRAGPPSNHSENWKSEYRAPNNNRSSHFKYFLIVKRFNFTCNIHVCIQRTRKYKSIFMVNWLRKM